MLGPRYCPGTAAGSAAPATRCTTAAGGAAASPSTTTASNGCAIETASTGTGDGNTYFTCSGEEGWATSSPTKSEEFDSNQYSFTGATSSYLTGFTAEFPAATVVRLVRDYRSTPQVVAVANQLIRSASPLAAQRPRGPRPVNALSAPRLNRETGRGGERK